ncbi:Conidiation protein 6-domain-containing protein [Mycena galericulata]|nr:Conidiation protein 6-domain-containing protein [Mycena galericulata]
MKSYAINAAWIRADAAQRNVYRIPQQRPSTRAGLKAALHRDDVSEQAKQHAEERLKEMGATSTDEHPDHLSSHALGGYKATLTSWYIMYSLSHADLFLDEATSDKAKAHAREILKAAGYDFTEADERTSEHQTRVLAGYKAALHNPRVSEEAKQHAREYLKEHDAV